MKNFFKKIQGFSKQGQSLLNHISNIESGQQRVDVVELQIFAKIYNKDIKYFIK